MAAGGGGRLLHRGRLTTREAEVRAAEHAKSLGASSSEAEELGAWAGGGRSPRTRGLLALAAGAWEGAAGLGLRRAGRHPSCAGS